MIRRHAQLTGSERAEEVLRAGPQMRPLFVRVIPNDYRRVLEAQKQMRAKGLSPEEAEMAAFELNAKDAARALRQVTEHGPRIMGKPTGFMEYRAHGAAVAASARAAARTGTSSTSTCPRTTLREQGARCMDCGVPFCHTGKLIDGLATGCPLNNLIPEWNDLVYRGRWREALDRLHKTNNFPEFTGRVCPAPCEGSCVLGINAPAVTIKSIEVRDRRQGLRGGLDRRPSRPRTRTGKKVAVVGSGPAGLAGGGRAEQGRPHWSRCSSAPTASAGLLMYGIPPMKLEKSLVERRVKLLAEEGVKFVTNTEVGKNYPTEKLRGGVRRRRAVRRRHLGARPAGARAGS